MSFIQLLSDNQLFQKFTQLVALLPQIMRWVEIEEDTGDTGEEKKARVLEKADATTRALERRGYLPRDASESMHKVAGELIDIVVTVKNETGEFKTTKKKRAAEETKDAASPQNPTTTAAATRKK
jgi:hypothetical protein